MSEIASIVYTPTSIKKTSKDKYDRVQTDYVQLVAGHGIAVVIGLNNHRVRCLPGRGVRLARSGRTD